MRFVTTSQPAFTPLSPPRPPRPTLALPPHASKRSSLIEYLQTKEQPPPEWHYRHHPTFTAGYPWTLVLSYLSNSSLLTLRLVSHAAKTWVSTASPPPFADLHIEFPTTSRPALQLSALKTVAKECRHLTITFPTIPLTIDPPMPKDSKLPDLPNLTKLSLICPTTEVFDRLLAFRLALQISSLPKLTHLAIASLSISGITALRWGTFTSFAESDWTDRAVWLRLQGLDVEIIPWWDTTPGRKMDQDQEQIWCTGIKILHDWLNSFARAGNLRKLKFAWVGADSVNPLLFDEVAAREKRGNWFSAPPMRMRALIELWLKGVWVGVEDVHLLKIRMVGLQLLMVEGRLAEKGVRGWRRMVEGEVWFEISLGEEPVALEGDTPMKGKRVVCKREVGKGETMIMPSLRENIPARGSRNGRYFA